MGKNCLEKQEKFFESHAVEFIREHEGMVAMIPDTLAVEFFDDIATAARAGWAKYGRGRIMLQDCTWDALKPKQVLTICAAK